MKHAGRGMESPARDRLAHHFSTLPSPYISAVLIAVIPSSIPIGNAAISLRRSPPFLAEVPSPLGQEPRRPFLFARAYF